MALPVVTVAEVQAWIEESKLSLATVDQEFHDTAKSIVYSRLSQAYDTTTWLTDATTPELIRKIIAMLIAAWVYARAYSEDNIATFNSYAIWLENKAYMLLEGLATGLTDLPDVVGIAVDNTPLFYPDDATEIADSNAAASFTVSYVF